MVVLKPESEPKLQERSIIFSLLTLVFDPITALANIHRKYGDVVLTRLFKRKLLFICDPTLIEEVFTLEAKNLVNRDFLYHAKKPVFCDGLLNSKVETWTTQRRIMHPFFTKEAITGWRPVMIKEVDNTVHNLNIHAKAEINLSHEIKTIVQNIFIKILFGRAGGNQNDGRLFQAIDTITRGLVPQLVTEILGKGKLKRLFIYQNRQYEKAIAKFTEFVRQEMSLAQNTSGQNLIAMLSQAKDKTTNETMTHELLEDEAINLFLAGQDTTINAISWFFYLLGKNAAIHDKITEEVSMYRDDPLTAENLSKLKYTKAALYETLRLYPPAPALVRQTLDNVTIGNHNIKKKTIIIISTYATHRNKTYWERPSEYYPDHFTNASILNERHKYAFFPFGAGIHHCIGRHLAELEMMIIIVSLLREFTFITKSDVKASVSVSLKPNRDIFVSLTPLTQSIWPLQKSGDKSTCQSAHENRNIP